MKFSELREADLSKAQIKKVHDKADDLPKNDFIKRYGKDGDAVRFATATNIVKKQLGIDESIIGVNKKSVEYKNGRAAAEKGVKYDKNPHAPGTKRLNWSMGHNDFRADTLRKAGKPNYGARGQFEDYEEGFKSDAQRKAAFASGYKEKGKNKKEELDDKDKETIKPIIKQLQKSVKAHGKQAKQLQKDIKDEVEEGFKNDAERQAAVASLYSKLGLKGASKRSREKDKGKKKEEVEITEAVSDAYVKQIARMTDRNDHFGARIELARMMKDKELMKMYDSLEKMHNMNLGGNDALTLRSKLDKNLKFRLTQKFKTDANKLMDAL
jgi:hypothetical protein